MKGMKVLWTLFLTTLLVSFAGAATVMDVDFEDTEYVLDANLPTQPTVNSDGSSWKIGYEGAADDWTTNATVKTKAPTTGGSLGWGTKCLDIDVGTIGPKALKVGDIAGVASGYDRCTFQVELAIVDSIDQNILVKITAKDGTSDWGPGEVIMVFLAKGGINDEYVFRGYLSDGNSVDVNTGITVTGNPVVRMILTLDKTLGSIVTGKLVDPLTDSVLWDSDVNGSPPYYSGDKSGLDRGLHGYSFQYNVGQTGRFQVDNILVTDTIDTAVDEWRLY